MQQASARIASAVRDVPDFPKPGIIFKDITPILSDGELFHESIDLFLDATRPLKPDKIVGIDARGFLFGSAVAYQLGIGFVPIRKKGKLPYQTKETSYSLEYGQALCWWMTSWPQAAPPPRRQSSSPRPAASFSKRNSSSNSNSSTAGNTLSQCR
jgi:adenine/guanine phosphoribosyltransferase-like PRPP-binding protein